MRRGAQSAEDGTFRIDGLDDAVFDVEATADDWGRLEMDPVRPPRGDLRFVLTRGAEVTFRLALPEGEPTPGQVRFGIKVAGSPAALTIREGDEQPFSGVLPPGRGEFVVQVDHWAVARRQIELKPAQELDLGEIVLDRGVVVAGRVIDAEGRGVAGAVVDALLLDQDWHFKGETLDPTATTDVSGAFRLERVPVGDVEVRVGADRFIEERRSVEILRDPRPLVLTLRRSH